MIIKTYIESPLDNNNYLLIDETTKEAVLIDCSSVELHNKIIKDLCDNNATLQYILLTHGHFDHITGIRKDLIKDTKVLMHEADTQWVENVNMYLPLMGLPEINIPKIDIFIKDNETIKFGNSEIKVIHTPGHTQGGVCYYIDGKLFSGDTIFRESVGRCDLPGGNFEQIVKSIQEKIYTLPEDTVIYPGHGVTTSVGWEKEHNYYN